MSWIAVGITAASFVTGQSQQSSARKSERKQSRMEYDYLGQQLSELNKSESQLEPVYESKLGVAQQQYQHDIAGLSAETGQSKEDLQQQFQSMIQKSGLATAGSANVKASQMWKRIGSGFQRGQQGLMGRLGEKMGAVEEWYESEKARLNSEKMRMEHQRRVSAQKGGMNSWANQAIKKAQEQQGQ